MVVLQRRLPLTTHSATRPLRRLWTVEKKNFVRTCVGRDDVRSPTDPRAHSTGQVWRGTCVDNSIISHAACMGNTLRGGAPHPPPGTAPLSGMQECDVISGVRYSSLDSQFPIPGQEVDGGAEAPPGPHGPLGWAEVGGVAISAGGEQSKGRRGDRGRGRRTPPRPAPPLRDRGARPWDASDAGLDPVEFVYPSTTAVAVGGVGHRRVVVGVGSLWWWGKNGGQSAFSYFIATQESR